MSRIVKDIEKYAHNIVKDIDPYQTWDDDKYVMCFDLGEYGIRDEVSKIIRDQEKGMYYGN